MIDLRGNVLDAGPHFRQVGVDLDGHAMAFAAGGIQKMDLPQLVVDQCRSIAGQAANIGSVIMQHLRNGLRAGVVAEDSDVAVASGEKKDPPAAVDGEEVRCSFVRNLDRVETLE